ncbi:DUF6708 domain-containing protein [Acinetobacter proteolyticus]|uniref:DUF6708 domain-containing protein n=1 Tax=Acinetobacter proteolyticus TaxID=1776741 RepID=A0A2N0WI38_9GAMM|nr:DUF6708 domain-containing protein [Acinetobacter proteolyticus]PKF35337.1 hypothetical protein CW311_04675 [Acinetobacter proteolyticus]
MIQAHYQGVIIPYRNYIGKKFNEIGEKIELDQKQSTGVEPVDADITIQFNSTYLEVLDKAYNWRGVINFFSIGLCIFALFMINLMILIILKVGFDWLAIAAFLLMSLFILGVFFIYKFFLKKDLFGYTHYPIRFNRKNRKVYVFKNKDDIRVFDWDCLKVAFTRIDTGSSRKRDYDIRLSQLSKDGTIEDAFSLSYINSAETIEYTEEDGYQFSFDVEAAQFASNWEYIRCYMEEGIEESYKAVRKLIPLDKKRESLLQSVKKAWYFSPKDYSFKKVETLQGAGYVVDIQKTYSDAFLSNLFKGLFFFIVMICFIGRPFVMHIAKRPKWTKQVEDACVVDTNDPYNYEKHPNQGHPKAKETALGIIVKTITFFLCYFSIYGFLWIFDKVAEVKGNDLPIRFSEYLAFWNWF